jgi:spore germination protein GerM
LQGRENESGRNVLRRIRGPALLPACVLAVALIACGERGTDAADDRDPPPEAEAPETRSVAVELFFTRDEDPAPVLRRVEVEESGGQAQVLERTLEALLRGPTPEEEAAGLTSWFSSGTEGMLRSVRLDDEGRAIVDFDDFSRVIPNAASSLGSTILLQELDRTLFQFTRVQSIEYRFEGSCDAFWNWIQRRCEVVRRPPGGGIGS